MNAKLMAELGRIGAEYEKAAAKFGPFNSAHEGYAVILEEVDELWDEVKGNHISTARCEALQVAAMGLRFLMDIGGE